MKLTIGEAREFVRARLDELAAQESDMLLDVIDDRNLDNTIDSLLEDAITYIHLAAPASLMEGPIITESNFAAGELSVLNRVLDVDTALADIEDDILRLISFQCGDSDIKLTSAFYEDSPEARMQLNKYIQGQPDSPALVRLDDSPNYKPHYKYYTTDMGAGGYGQALHFALRYFPRPRLQGGSLSLTPSALNMVAGTGSKTVTVYSTSAWRITSTVPDWIQLSEREGVGTATITVTARANEGSERSLSLIFVNDEGSASLEIKQRAGSESAGGELLRVTSTAMVNNVITIPASNIANVYYLRVSAVEGLAWSATLSDPGEKFYISPTSGVGSGLENYSTVAVRATGVNDSDIPNEATITFTASGVTPIIIGLRQPARLAVTPEGGSTSVPASQGSLRFFVSTEGPWTAEVADTSPEGFYLSNYEGNGEGSFIAYYPENPVTQIRLLQITVSSGGASLDVIIAQQPGVGVAIGVVPGELGPFPASGILTGLTVTANVQADGEWTVDTSTLPNWATVTYSTQDNEIVIQSMTANESTVLPREANIKVYLVNSPGDAAYLSFTQEVSEGEISLVDTVSPYTSVSIPAEGGSYTALLSATGPWTLSTQDSWITNLSPTSGDAGTNIQISFRVGSTSSARPDGRITAALTNTTKTAIYFVSQQAPVEEAFEITRRSNSFYDNTGVTNDLAYEGFDVYAPGPWTADCDKSWVHPYNTASWSGNGSSPGTKVTRWFYAEANPGPARTATITGYLTGTGRTAKFYINQDGDGTPYLDASFNKKSYDSTSQTITLQIRSNISWSITNVSSGLTIASADRNGSGPKDIDVSLGSTGSQRTLSVTVSNVSYGRTATATATQKAPVSNNRLVIAPNGDLPVAYDTRELRIDITDCNVSWTATCTTPGASINLSPNHGSNTGSIMAYFEANTNEHDTQSYAISVSGGGITRTLTIIQAAKPAAPLTVSPTSVSISGFGGSQTVYVTAQAAWSLTKSHSWIQTSVSPGTSSQASSFTISAEATNATRSGSVVITSGTATKTVTVTQTYTGSIIASTNEILLEGGRNASKSITVFATGAWEVDDDNPYIPDWLEYTYTTHAGSANGETLTFFANSANMGSGTRGPAIMYLKLVNATDSGSYFGISISQKKALGLSVVPSTTNAPPWDCEGNLEVVSDVAWRIVQITEGLVIESDQQSGPGGTNVITWNLPANTGLQRTFTVEFMTDDGSPQPLHATATIIQAAGYLRCSINGSFAGSGEEIASTVFSSAAWEIVSYPSWMLIQPMSGPGDRDYVSGTPITFAALPNRNTSLPRSGEVLFQHTSNPNSQLSLNVNQTPSDSHTLTISPTELVLPDDSEYEGTLQISTDVSWEILTNDYPNGYRPNDNPTVEPRVVFEEWSGTGNAEVAFTVLQNTEDAPRSLWVKVLINGGTTIRTLNIWQPAETASLIVYPEVDEIVFTQSTPTAEIAVRSLAGWVADTHLMPWLTISPSSAPAGYTNVTLSATIDRTQAKTGNLTITSGTETITIACRTVPPFVPID